MSNLDKVISDAVAKQDAPFLVAMTANASGVTWSGAAGERTRESPRRKTRCFASSR
jgi:methyl acetate hydrolase